MTVQVRVFQTTIVRPSPSSPGAVEPERVLVSCRSLDGGVQFSMQTELDAAPVVGEAFDISIEPVVVLQRAAPFE